MKKKSLIIGYLIITIQMAILGFPFFSGVLASKNAPVWISSLILGIGLLGGYKLKKISEGESKHTSKYNFIVIVVGSIITTIGAFVTLLPGWFIITESSVCATMLIIGFIAPAVMYKH